MLDVIIIGTGFSGICAAIKLREAGFSVLMLEQEDTLGGTWRDNTYPGCACDVPSVLYSLSFAPNKEWTRSFPQQPEIHAYMKRVFIDYELHDVTRFQHRVIRCEFDEASHCWRVSARTPISTVTFEARFQVLGLGPLNKPSLPRIEGEGSFRGQRFHSMHWQHDIDFADKKVVVIGTGASAIQFVPEIAKHAAQVTVFQRTPPWVVPRRDRALGALHRAARRVAILNWLERAFIYWRNELVAVAFLGNRRLLNALKWAGRWNIKRALRNHPHAEALIPDYAPGCKRLLVSDDWYPTLARANVRVVSSAPLRFDATGVFTAEGEHIDANVVIYGTGFRVQEFVRPVQVLGREGVDAAELWRDRPAPTYYGVAARMYPNSFALVGPNTGLGHNSIIFMIEAQVHWIVEAIKYARRNGYRRIEVRDDAQAACYECVQKQMKRTVWASGGCKSYYQATDGRIDTLWPNYTWKYWLFSRKFKASDFEFQ
ncbi:MAG: flavin-containing monooxygenase [Casimicrobium sp.]